MTEAELEEVLHDCPTLYHMAEGGSWSSIQKHGLHSTSSLLDLYRITGTERDRIESERRGSSVAIRAEGLGVATVRDQKPMNDGALRSCLLDELDPADWYRILNGKVFFWLTRSRLHGLLTAPSYAMKTHDVLEIDAIALVQAYRPKITLSPINSGATVYKPQPRGLATFLSSEDYPYAHWRKDKKRPRGKAVVELCVQGAVPDVERYVRRVVSMRGMEERGTI